MRVLHVLNALRPSGAETMLRSGACRWHEQGVELAVLSTGNEVGEYAVELEAAGYRVFHVPIVAAAPALVRLTRFFAEHAFDIIHLHAERCAFTVALAAWLSGQRGLVRTVHNNFRRDGIRRLLRSSQRQVLRSLGVRGIAISTSVHATELDCYGNDTEVIWNWYDDTHFRVPNELERDEARAAYGIGREIVAIVSLGNCSKQKNHMALLEALDTLPASAGWVYVHAGKEEEGRPEYAFAQRSWFAERARFAGPVTDVRTLLWAADVFVMPSLYEGLPIAALEAIACGVRIVLTDVVGLADLRACFDDLVYCAPHENALAEAVGAALWQQPGAKSAREQRTARAQRAFGIARGTAEYLAVYRALVQPLARRAA